MAPTPVTMTTLPASAPALMASARPAQARPAQLRPCRDTARATSGCDRIRQMPHKLRQAHQRHHNQYTQAGDKPVDYVGTDRGQDVVQPHPPLDRPQQGPDSHIVLHRTCGCGNGGWPAQMAVIPSIHRPYDYDDSLSLSSNHP